MTLKTQATKIIDKLDFIKIENVCASKDTVSKVKRQPTERVKMFPNLMSNKRLIPKILHSYNSRTKNQNN